jgi:hypothetical protein
VTASSTAKALSKSKSTILRTIKRFTKVKILEKAGTIETSHGLIPAFRFKPENVESFIETLPASRHAQHPRHQTHSTHAPTDAAPASNDGLTHAPSDAAPASPDATTNINATKINHTEINRTEAAGLDFDFDDYMRKAKQLQKEHDEKEAAVTLEKNPKVSEPLSGIPESFIKSQKTKNSGALETLWAMELNKHKYVSGVND